MEHQQLLLAVVVEQVMFQVITQEELVELEEEVLTLEVYLG